MRKYIISRLLHLLIVFFGVSLFTYALTSAAIGVYARPGADKPSFIAGFISWLHHILFEGNVSYAAPRRSIFSNFGNVLPGTIRLACVTFIVVVVFSLLIGILAALKKDSGFGYFIRFTTFVGTAIPHFVLGVFFIFAFCLGLKWFSVINSTGPKGILLPVFALATPLISRYASQVNAAVLEELKLDYVAGAAARGISRRRILWLHVLPNAMPTILSSLGVITGYLLSGIVVIETMFVRPGIGYLAMQSIRLRDYSVMQAYVMLMAIFYIVARFFIDLLVFIFDPQLHRKGTA